MNKETKRRITPSRVIFVLVMGIVAALGFVPRNSTAGEALGTAGIACVVLLIVLAVIGRL